MQTEPVPAAVLETSRAAGSDTGELTTALAAVVLSMATSFTARLSDMDAAARERALAEEDRVSLAHT